MKNYIVVGCGRIGAALAYRLFKSGHYVTIIDARRESFSRLPDDFRGRIVTEDVLKEGTLLHAGVEEADGLAAVTNFDPLNAVVAHVARTFYSVPIVVARNYDPGLRPMLEAFNLQIVSSTAWGAQRLEELLSTSSGQVIFSAGNGEVEVYEVTIPATWKRRKLQELLQGIECLPVALTRAGRSSLPLVESVLEEGDVLHVSATFDGISALLKRLELEKEA
ncbi:MAG: NAD-binding protein [Anaerolineales bacterium]